MKGPHLRLDEDDDHIVKREELNYEKSALKAIQAVCGQHVHVKFCSVRPSQLAISSKFKEGGVPAVLAYRGGQLFGNCVRFTAKLEGEFEADEFESYLVEHGILNDRGWCRLRLLIPVMKTD